MWEDPIVAEVRRVREELSARFNHDVHAVFTDLRKRQIAVGDRLVRRGKQATSNPIIEPKLGAAPPE